MTPTPIGLPDEPDDWSSSVLFEPGVQDARDANRVLTAQESHAVWALANGKTIKQAAKAAACGRSTIVRWKRAPHFSAALKEATDILLGITDPAVLNCKARIQRKSPKVGDRLTKIALDDDHPDQFRAISKVLEVAGLTGSKGATQTNVQVNVDASTQLQSIHEKAQVILDAEAAANS